MNKEKRWYNQTILIFCHINEWLPWTEKCAVLSVVVCSCGYTNKIDYWCHQTLQNLKKSTKCRLKTKTLSPPAGKKMHWIQLHLLSLFSQFIWLLTNKKDYFSPLSKQPVNFFYIIHPKKVVSMMIFYKMKQF